MLKQIVKPSAKKGISVLAVLFSHWQNYDEHILLWFYWINYFSLVSWFGHLSTDILCMILWNGPVIVESQLNSASLLTRKLQHLAGSTLHDDLHPLHNTLQLLPSERLMSRSSAQNSIIIVYDNNSIVIVF